jgi:hypothetical protein
MELEWGKGTGGREKIKEQEEDGKEKKEKKNCPDSELN